MKLIPVKYHNKNYPRGISHQLVEVAGNLDSKQIDIKIPYSLHTEYSYMKRDFNSELLFGLDEIRNSQKNGIPQLWKSKKWSEEYAVFIERLIGKSSDPEVIEIHPPFKEYCNSVEVFWDRYLVFYNAILKKYPKTKILIENRCGTMYTGSSFLFSTCDDIINLCDFLSKRHNELGVIIDYPQLFSAEKIKMENVKIDKILDFNESLKKYSKFVQAIHLWGKRKSLKTGRWAPHTGDLNTFFSNDDFKKLTFIESLKETYSDDIERYFIPEVNSSEDDLHSIIKDLVSSGIEFINPKFQEHLITIDWENSFPQFILCDNTDGFVRKINAIGSFYINVGTEKYCVGNKDINSHEYTGCPMHSKIIDKSTKCFLCNQNDLLKYCVRCTGKQCFAKHPDVLKRCNQEHFVYLAYFPNNVVKVGVAHNRRKYIRLFEQGSLCSLIIASCPSGRIARQFENSIREIGFKDRVTSKYKINNLNYFELSYAHNILMDAYHTIVEKLKSNHLIKNYLLSVPEIISQKDVLSILFDFSYSYKQQLTFEDYLSDNNNFITHFNLLDDVDDSLIRILTFVGSIAIFEMNGDYYLYDFKKLIGREIKILENKTC